jgi:hypothetical protein
MAFEGMPCLDRARRGIEALREPTEATLLAGMTQGLAVSVPPYSASYNGRPWMFPDGLLVAA